jgi:hypothetical protein
MAKKKTKKPEKKVGKTAMVLAAVATLLVASGITGYKLVKTKNYGAIQDNLHKVILSAGADA